MAKAPESLPPQVVAAFERGRPIEAIKLLLQLRARGALAPRSSASVPVKQPSQAAKPPAPAAPPGKPQLGTRSGLSPGEVPRTESAVWVWVVVALLAYLAYRLAGQ